MEKRDRHPAGLFPAQLHARDVDALLPQQSAHSADHAGDIPVVKDENVAFGNRLKIKAVDPDDSWVVVAEDRPFDLKLFLLGLDLHRNRAGEVARPAALGLDDFYSPLPRDHRGVDVINA